jgi:hypothetical protein
LSHARAEREQLQRACIARLAAEIPAQQVQLPLLLEGDFRRREIETLGQLLAAGFGQPKR